MSKGGILSVVGAGFGDEGKGKITDYYANNWANVVVRANGGCNAGHTVTVGDTKVALRALPSGVLNDKVVNIIGHGCVINPKELLEEIDKVQSLGFECILFISNRAHIITEYDIAYDKATGGKIRTTGNGIGICYAERALRNGIRTCDLLETPEKIKELLKETLSYQLYNDNDIDLDVYSSILSEYGKSLKEYLCDTAISLNGYLHHNDNILFEGAQAAMLDNSYGYYPYVTSSNPTTAGLSVGSGIAPKYFNNTIGVIKAYCTRVGAGPFISECDEELANIIREKAHEYGTVTGRPRRIGYFDCPIVNLGKQLSGYDSLAVMLLDILSGIDELKICIGYEDKSGNATATYEYSPSIERLEDFKPMFLTVPGWKEDISSCRTFEELPENAQNYIKQIEEFTNLPVKIISVGPDREQTIIRDI